MSRTHPLDTALERYSITARTVLNLKPSKRLGELTLYTAATGSALALAPGAEASIIYSGVKNVTIHRITNGAASASVDLNSDGKNDLQFTLASSTGAKYFGSIQTDFAIINGPNIDFLKYAYDTSLARASGRILKYPYSQNNSGSYGSLTWIQGRGSLLRHMSNFYNEGILGSGGSAIIGAALFAGAGEPNLAWLRFNPTVSYVGPNDQRRTDSLTLVDWAYQSVPGKSIRGGDTGSTPSVPEPSTLGLMALGATGIAVLRRRRKQEKNTD